MFAEVQDLADVLSISLNADDSRATLLLENATGLIQAEANQTIEYVKDDAIEMPGGWSQEIWLPERPVIDVTSITVNGLPLTPGAYTFSSSGQLYRGRLPLGNAPEWDELDFPAGSIPGGASWGGPQSTVAVTYSHGFKIIPKDVRAVCLAIAARAWTNPENLTSFTTGNYSETSSGSAAVSLNDDERRVCQRYSRGLMSVPANG